MRLRFAWMIVVILSIVSIPMFSQASDIPKKVRVGASTSYLNFFETNLQIPMYGANIQYRLRPQWTLDGTLGVSTLQKHAIFEWSDSEDNVFSRRNYDLQTLFIPLKIGVTKWIRPESPMRIRGYTTLGASIFNVIHSSRAYPFAPLYDGQGNLIVPEEKSRRMYTFGWLIGPYGALGMDVPVSRTVSFDLTFLEFSYHRALNHFLQTVDGFVFSAGAGIRF